MRERRLVKYQASGNDFLLVDGEVAVDRGDDLGQLGHDLGVGCGEEVDHPGRPEGDVPQREGGPHRERLEEALCGAAKLGLVPHGVDRHVSHE